MTWTGTLHRLGVPALLGSLFLGAAAGACTGARPAAEVAPATEAPPAAPPEAAAGSEPLPATAERELPDTVAGRTFSEWLALYNGGSEDEIQSFIGTRFAPEFLARLPVAALVAFHLQTRQITGELTPVEFDPVREHTLQVTAGSAAGPITVVLAVEPGPPHRISELRVVPEGS